MTIDKLVIFVLIVIFWESQFMIFGHIHVHALTKTKVLVRAL